MGVFGSGDKTSSSFDNRTGASENAQAVGAGGFVFNAAGSKQSTPFNFTPWIIGGIVALLIWTLVIRKI